VFIRVYAKYSCTQHESRESLLVSPVTHAPETRQRLQPSQDPYLLQSSVHAMMTPLLPYPGLQSQQVPAQKHVHVRSVIQ